MWCLQNKEDEWKWNPMFSTGLVSLIHFSRGPAACQDHTSKGTRESVFPGPSTDVLHFLCCFICCLLGACQTGKGSEKECIRTSLGRLDKVLEEWASEGQAPASRGHGRRPLIPGHTWLSFTGACNTLFSFFSMMNYDSMALYLKQAEFSGCILFCWKNNPLSEVS